MFISPTEMLTSLRVTTASVRPCCSKEGWRFSGYNVCARQQTEMTLLSVVNGSCGSVPCKNPWRQFSGVTPERALMAMGAPKKCKGRSYLESSAAVARAMAAKIEPMRKR